MSVNEIWFYFSRSLIIVIALLYLLFVGEFESVRAVYERY